MRAKKNDLIFLIAIGIVVILVLMFTPIEKSMFGVFLEQFSKVDWNEVKERNIVKNSIPIIMLEEKGSNCIVNADNFDIIISHEYFERSADLERELSYDSENETLLVSCDLLDGEKSRLHVWYALIESEKHATKYEYFITPWNVTEPTIPG